jgi:hypothetical protein
VEKLCTGRIFHAGISKHSKFSATACATDPSAPNYFSDAESERTATVAEEYKQAGLAEQAAAAAKELPLNEQPVGRKKNCPPSPEHCDIE